MNTEKIENEITKIKERNKRVEADKAWEVSAIRKICIAILTYAVIVIFFKVVNLPKPFINSIVPTSGFVLSTLSLSLIKKFWIKKFYKK